MIVGSENYYYSISTAMIHSNCLQLTRTIFLVRLVSLVSRSVMEHVQTISAYHRYGRFCSGLKFCKQGGKHSRHVTLDKH